jgi:hypothetical protein
MNRLSMLTILLGVVAVSAAALAEPVRSYFDNTSAEPVRTYFSASAKNGLRGWHIDRDSSDLIPHGISLDLDGKPVWGTAAIDYEMPDLILAYSYVTKTDQFRMRPDTGQIDVGPIVGHPVTQNQFNVTAGTPEAPLDGVGVGSYGNRSGVYLYQKSEETLRTKINFNRVFQIGTDSSQGGTPDLWVHNVRTGRLPVVVSPTDEVTLGFGARIGGTFQHVGRGVGFNGAKPLPKPVITGSRSDGTALAQLLSRLDAMGLIVNNSTP